LAAFGADAHLRPRLFDEFLEFGNDTRVDLTQDFLQEVFRRESDRITQDRSFIEIHNRAEASMHVHGSIRLAPKRAV
jgi:DNA relaxase NicK